MQVNLEYQGVESSPWMERFITRKLEKLNRYLTPASTVKVLLIKHQDDCEACIEVTNNTRFYTCSSKGGDIHSAFSDALEKASRELGEQKRRARANIHSKFFSIKKGYAA